MYLLGSQTYSVSSVTFLFPAMLYVYGCVLHLQTFKLNTLVHSEYLHEAIRREIRLAREHFTGQALSLELGRIQKRLDSVELLSPDIVMSLLLSYRDIPVRTAVICAIN